MINMYFNNKLIVTKENIIIGEKVIRGPDWQYGTQDDNEKGVIIAYPNTLTSVEGWCTVKWDRNTENYRVGYKNCYDLCYVNNSCIEDIFTQITNRLTKLAEIYEQKE